MLRIKRNRRSTLQGSTAGTLATGIYQVDDYQPGYGIYYYIQKNSPFKFEIYDGTKAATLAGGSQNIKRVPTYLVNDYIPMLSKGIYNVPTNPLLGTYKIYEATDFGTIVYSGKLSDIKAQLHSRWPLSEVDSNKNISIWDELARLENGNHIFIAPQDHRFEYDNVLADLKAKYDAAQEAYLAANMPTVTTANTTTTNTPAPAPAPQGMDKNIIIVLALGATGVAAWYFTRNKKRK